MFIQSTIEEALDSSIVNNLKKRRDEACSTWDLNKIMAYAVGVKEELAIDEVEAVTEYMNTLTETKLNLSSNESVNILKADVKVRKDSAFLIYRYQLIQKPVNESANLFSF